MKKLFKKRLNKKTVEAYACPSCGTPDGCMAACAGDPLALTGGANYAVMLLTSRT